MSRLGILLATAACLTLPAVAHADIITTLLSSNADGNGNYVYVYNMSLSANSQLDPVVNGAPVQFGTIYDFGPETSAPVATGIIATDFTWTFPNSSTPAAQTTPFDNPGLRNIRFTFTGTTGYATAPGSTVNQDYTIIPAGDANLGTLTLTSIYNVTPTASAQYDGQSYNSVNGTQQSNVGSLRGPDVQNTVPEPASLALIGAGLVGVGFMRRRRSV